MVELEELEQILDEENQPRLSDDDKKEKEDAGATSEGGTPASTPPSSVYAQVQSGVSGVSKFIVEQAQRPTVVVGAVAGAGVGAIVAGPLGAAAGQSASPLSPLSAQDL